MYKLREISRGNFDDRGYSNEDTIANLKLKAPASINNMLTYTYGLDDDRFPLTFLTEGQGTSGTVDIDTDQWTWPVMGRMQFHDYVVWFNTSNTTPGKGGAMFDVEFKTHRIIEQYGLVAPDGTQVRVMKDKGAGSHGGFLYTLKIFNPDPNAYVNPDSLTVGKYWSMTAPTIPASYSKGNRSNVMGPGKMTSQLEYHRYSKEIAGDVSNVVVEYEFQTTNGGTTKAWINEEMRQFDIQVRVMEEEVLWLSEYNRTLDGEITMIDPDNGQPISKTAGMFQICRESNYDTYGLNLTLNKLTRTIGDVIDKDTDRGTMEIVLAGGKGAFEDFDLAIRNDAKSEGFMTPLGDKMIEDYNGDLSYGKYFRRYKMPDGHIVTLKYLPFLDLGTLADRDKANGYIHPRTGRPMCSHKLMMLDMSKYQGVNNVRKVRKKGEIYKSRVLKGLTDVPASWGPVSKNEISTEIDMSRYEVKTSAGLQVNKDTKFFMLECKL